jgi:hypothetical protein
VCMYVCVWVCGWGGVGGWLGGVWGEWCVCVCVCVLTYDHTPTASLIAYAFLAQATFHWEQTTPLFVHGSRSY